MKKLTIAQKWMQMDARINTFVWVACKVGAVILERTAQAVMVHIEAHEEALSAAIEGGEEGLTGAALKLDTAAGMREGVEYICAALEESEVERQINKEGFDKIKRELIVPTFVKVWKGELGLIGFFAQSALDMRDGIEMALNHSADNAEMLAEAMKEKMGRFTEGLEVVEVDAYGGEGMVEVVDATDVGDKLKMVKEALRREGIHIVEPQTN